MKATTMVKIINILVFGSLLYGLSFTFGTTNVASKDASCDLKTQCLVSDHWPCNCNHKGLCNNYQEGGAEKLELPSKNLDSTPLHNKKN